MQLQVEQATIQLPSIDLGTSRLKGNWELELPVSASPSGLAERPAPYTTELVIEIDAQKDRSVSVPVEVFVVAAPVASTSVWGETPPGSLCVAPGAGKNYEGFETYAGLGSFTSPRSSLRTLASYAQSKWRSISISLPASVALRFL